MTIQTYTYPNGFRIIYEKSKSSLPISSIFTFCDAGSVHEPDNLRGVSHFIEHMCFKGTKKIPKAKDIFMHYDNIGAEFSAFTVQRFTCYTVKCIDEKLHESIQIVSDMLLNSTFDKKEFKKEYNVVVEENSRNENDTDVVINEAISKLLYNGSSYANPIDTLSYHKKRMFEYEEVMKYYKTFYSPDRLTISIVSNIPFSEFKRMLKSTYFVKTPRPNQGILSLRESIQIQHELIPQSDIQIKIEKKTGMETNILAIGFRVCGNSSPDKYKLDILQEILGGDNGTKSGRVYMILREKHGLTYHPEVGVTYFEKTGDLSMYIQIDSRTIMKNGKEKGIVPLVIDLLNNLILNGITQEELATAKGFIKGSNILVCQDTDNPCEYNGEEYLLHGSHEKIIPIVHLFEKCYRDITVNDINDIIRKYLIRENMSVCILGEHVPSLKNVKSAFEHFIG